MFSEIGQIIFDKRAVAKTYDFTMGLEVEMHRIDSAGNISQEPYPLLAGDETTNPWLTNDYLETMSEMVTPAAKRAEDALQYLYGINTVLRRALAPGELLWPLAMPPALPDDKSKMTVAKKGPVKEAYYKAWIKRHGYAQGAPSGTHINLSIDDDLFELLQTHLSHRFANKQALKNYLYEIVAQGFVRYRWLLTYLFGASPLAEKNYFATNEGLAHPVRSIRQSPVGFGTKFQGDYTNVTRYAAAINQGIKRKILSDESEFHGPVRFKGAGSVQQLAKTGVDYLELRMLDLDSTSPVGVRASTLLFMRVLASYFIMHPALPAAEVVNRLTQADAMNATVALEEPTQPTQYQQQALAVMQELERFLNQIQAGSIYLELMADLTRRIKFPQETPSARLLGYTQNGSLTPYAVATAKRYQQAAQESLLSFRGFERGEVLSAAELTEKLFDGNWQPVV